MTTDNQSSLSSANLDRRKAVGALGAIGVGGVAATLASSDASAATVSRTDVANALGFYPVLSDTAPQTTTVGNVPVVWFEKNPTIANIPVIPIAPYFDAIHAQYYLPSNVVGIQYQDSNGNILKTGTMVPVTGAGTPTLTIKAVALPGYVLADGVQTSWTHIFTSASTAQTVLTSDTFTGPAGGLDGHKLDNKLGGSGNFAWKSFWTGSGTGSEGYQLTGNNSLTNSGMQGWYFYDTGCPNFRVEFDFKWLVASPQFPAFDVTVGAAVGDNNTNVNGGVSLSLNNSGYRLYVPTASGNIIATSASSGGVGNGGYANDGHYILEIFNNQVGLKVPNMSVMQFIDVTYVDSTHGLPDKNRGTRTALRSEPVNAANYFSITNYKVTKLG